MKPVISEPRTEISKYAPRIVSTQIKVEKIKRRNRTWRKSNKQNNRRNRSKNRHRRRWKSIYIFIRFRKKQYKH